MSKPITGHHTEARGSQEQSYIALAVLIVLTASPQFKPMAEQLIAKGTPIEQGVKIWVASGLAKP